MAQSGQFSQAKQANAAGTMTDISTYLKSWTPQRASDDTDLTTFASRRRASDDQARARRGGERVRDQRTV
jgi:hypothetical protein